MLSFCRSGLLALTLMSGSIVGVHADIQRVAHQDWASDVSVERLQDKSVLVEYFGESTSREHEGITFRVGFIPRFGCAPLITFRFTQSLLEESDFSPYSVLSVSIDGDSLGFPTLIDDDGSHVAVYLNANLQRRITARLRVEVGSNLRLNLQGKRVGLFSLQGSRDAISIANQNCRRHTPGAQW